MFLPLKYIPPDKMEIITQMVKERFDFNPEEMILVILKDETLALNFMTPSKCMIYGLNAKVKKINDVFIHNMVAHQINNFINKEFKEEEKICKVPILIFKDCAISSSMQYVNDKLVVMKFDKVIRCNFSLN